MSHYSNDPQNVRVDFFKPSGKWYATEQVTMVGWRGDEVLIHDSLVDALDNLERKDGGPLFRGMQVICLEPYHEFSHPISIKEWNGKEEWLKEKAEIKRKIGMDQGLEP